jgi:hypothetical protein
MLPEYIAGLRKIDDELLQPAIKSEDDMTDIDVGGLAMVVLGCKVAELGKQQSQPTKEQTFARVYEDPKNSEIAKAERRANGFAKSYPPRAERRLRLPLTGIEALRN